MLGKKLLWVCVKIGTVSAKIIHLVFGAGRKPKLRAENESQKDTLEGEAGHVFEFQEQEDENKYLRHNLMILNTH